MSQRNSRETGSTKPSGKDGSRDKGPSCPLLISDQFDGETNFDEWMSHFENVAELNGWTDEEKLRWLKVRLI